jgi:antitoxin component YwqK of YwqJK toxin-antitoxin module
MSRPTIKLVPYYHTCCEDVDRPYCLNYSNSNGELAATRFTYDGKGRNDKAFYQNITGNRSSRNYHEFDGNGRMVRKCREYNDGETSTERFSYDEEDRLIEESFESSNGPKGTARYEYSAEGNAERMLCDGYKGWLHGEIHFEFDEQGKRTSGIIFKDGKPCGTIAYQYDRGGNLLKEDWDLDGKWSQTLVYVYEPLASAAD